MTKIARMLSAESKDLGVCAELHSKDQSRMNQDIHITISIVTKGVSRNNTFFNPP